MEHAESGSSGVRESTIQHEGTFVPLNLPGSEELNWRFGCVSVIRSDSEAFEIKVAERTDVLDDPKAIDAASGVRVWEGGLDLARHLARLPEKDCQRLKSANMLELGAGHGVPGIVAIKRFGVAVDFHDLNPSVLQEVTTRNLVANDATDSVAVRKPRLLAGDWEGLRRFAESTGLRYDAVIAAEAIYDTDAYPALAALLRCLLTPLPASCDKIPTADEPMTQRTPGVAWFAGKRFYFGCGGGTLSFAAFLRQEGFSVEVAEIIEDGRSNIREILRCSLPENDAGAVASSTAVDRDLQDKAAEEQGCAWLIGLQEDASAPLTKRARHEE